MFQHASSCGIQIWNFRNSKCGAIHPGRAAGSCAASWIFFLLHSRYDQPLLLVRSENTAVRYLRWGVDMKIKFLGGIENLKIKSAFSLPNFSNFPTFSIFFCIFWVKYKNVQQLSEVSRNSDKIQWKYRRKMTDFDSIAATSMEFK